MTRMAQKESEKKPSRQLASVFDYFLVSWSMGAGEIRFNAIRARTVVRQERREINYFPAYTAI